MSWQKLLWQAVNETNRATVARKLGVSRTSVSLLLANRYPGDTRHMARRINTILAQEPTHTCQLTGRKVTITGCAKKSARVPTSSPAAVRNWKVCKDCPHNPHQKEQ